MYLSYAEYQGMGGEMDNVAFSKYERRAEMLINSEAGGLTGKRIQKLGEVPKAVKGCVFDLIEAFKRQTDMLGAVTSESQTSAGVSESISYNVKSDKETEAACEDIIYNAFFGSGYGYLLVRGHIDGD